MEHQKGINLFFAFIAVVIGWTLFKHIDFRNLTLKEPVLDILYLIVFVMSLYWLIKGFKKQGKR